MFKVSHSWLLVELDVKKEKEANKSGGGGREKRGTKKERLKFHYLKASKMAQWVKVPTDKAQ